MSSLTPSINLDPGLSIAYAAPLAVFQQPVTLGGGTHFLLARNGRGKSTLLRTIANSGVPLSTAFAKYTSVDSQVTHMLSIGEKSASLDAQLEMLAVMYEEDAENYMAVFSATVSFVVLLIAVSLIAAVFVGNFLPIFLMGPKMMQSGI